MCLFVSLFGVFRPTLNFSLIWRPHHYQWRMEVLSNSRQSWQLSSEGSKPPLTWGIRLRWSYPRTRDTHTCCETLGSFNDFGTSRPRFEHQTLRMQGERFMRLNRHAPRQKHCIWKYMYILTPFWTLIWHLNNKGARIQDNLSQE